MKQESPARKSSGFFVFGPGATTKRERRPITEVGNRSPRAGRYSDMALRVHLRPSHSLAWALVVAHAASACVLIPLDLATGFKIALVVLIAFALAHSLWRTVLLRDPRSVVGIRLLEGDRIDVQTSDGEWHEARLLGTTYVTPLLTVLNLRLVGRRFARHVVIAPDSADAAELRRMRVRLRWACVPQTSKTGVPY